MNAALPINHVQILLQLTLSAILGGLIGLERQRLHKPAGFRTGMLVSLGSTLFTVIALYPLSIYFESPSHDPTRLIAQVVVGIGFIGAGVIFHKRDHVEGITTAASLWVIAAIGIAVGVSFYLEAIFVTLMVLIILIVLGKLEVKYNLKDDKES